jgi:hypothetical protein
MEDRKETIPWFLDFPLTTSFPFHHNVQTQQQRRRRQFKSVSKTSANLCKHLLVSPDEIWTLAVAGRQKATSTPTFFFFFLRMSETENFFFKTLSQPQLHRGAPLFFFFFFSCEVITRKKKIRAQG